MRRVSGSGAWRSRKPSSDDERALAHHRQQERGDGEVGLVEQRLQRGPAADGGQRERRRRSQRGPAGEHLDVAGLVGDRDGEHLLDLAEVRVDLAEEPGRHDERGLLVLDQVRHHLDDGVLDARAVRRSAPSSRWRWPGPTGRRRPGRRARRRGRSRRSSRSVEAERAASGRRARSRAPRAARPQSAAGARRRALRRDGSAPPARSAPTQRRRPRRGRARRRPTPPRGRRVGVAPVALLAAPGARAGRRARGGCRARRPPRPVGTSASASLTRMWAPPSKPERAEVDGGVAPASRR